MDRIDVLVVGAGVVGLACARELASAGLEVVIAERAGLIGSGVSSRNSEVIHAGLYYPEGSLKARLCHLGRDLLYAYCESRHVAYRRCGKLVVASSSEGLDRLRAIERKATANGVPGLQWLPGAEARELEPAVCCDAALLSPHSGIVDSHGLMTALLGDAQAAGAMLALDSAVAHGTHGGSGWRITTTSGRTTETEPFELVARWVVNAAGLDAQHVARQLEGFPAGHVPPRHMARGHYFSLSGRAPFSRLIYPTPVNGGLGVHLTLDLGGQAKFGPDVEWFSDDAPGHELDYRVKAERAGQFEAAIRSYWPGLPQGALSPAYSGIRPKITGPGEPDGDFRIDGPTHHGCAGVINLFGIESPGLTSCLAIAAEVARQIRAYDG